ncbi:DNA adenine methylase [Staphylococcus hominis]|uniref:DNA adenine methylase n=1 Tax=Staphylococcus hominis TaxID=1290 RepID=UPI002879B8BA|nr:DNA adenine methylase [Staphylococcus hominis]MDS3866541.1 DNA adenine methylase [Staphylococcus hominis]
MTIAQNNFKVMPYPHLIKYMGSKSKIIDYIIDGLNSVSNTKYVIDLFAGSSSLSGALRGQTNIISNDIQSYSEVLAKAYLSNINNLDMNSVLKELRRICVLHVSKLNTYTTLYDVDYNMNFNLSTFQESENIQRNLIYLNFKDISYHLFTKYYSGTYWSSKQCKWIDSIRFAADNFKNSDVYNIIISSLMYAMSYTAQSTGHYAQYRIANTINSMNDILIYRRKSIWPLFEKKFIELFEFCKKNISTTNIFHSIDYEECLDTIPMNSTIYADPPYSLVHYSRFYHVLETLVKYDYPEIKYKGRYRIDRHQSPFSIKTKAPIAFKKMFIAAKEKNSNLILSYSNNGVISLKTIRNLAQEVFDSSYSFDEHVLNYRHSRMGRIGDKDVEVEEALLIFKYKNN